MSQISDFSNPWRDILLSEPASFRGIIFHAESTGVTGGRRVVVHEYPKRNEPYAEDMGRQARRFQFSGYLIYRPSNPLYVYTEQRGKLYKALEDDDPGKLIHPVFAIGGIQVMCERFTMTESRDKGGYTQYEMQFVWAGKAVSSLGIGVDPASNVDDVAKTAENTAVEQVKNGTSSGSGTITIRPITGP